MIDKYSQGSQQHHSVKPKHLTFKLNLAQGGGASPVYVSRGTMTSGSHMLKKYGVKPQLQKYNTLSSTNIHCKYKHIPHINKYRHTNTHMLNTLLDSKLKETDYYKNIFTDNNNQCKFNTISLKFHPEPLDPLIQKELDIITTTTNNNNKTCSPSSHYQQRFSRNTPSSPHAITPSKSNYTTPYANKPAFAASLPVNRVASASNLLHLNTNKLLFSNISPSKKHFILKLAELQHELGTTASSASIQYIKQLKKPNNPQKRSALIDRYMFKMVNPDGTIDDYITEDETKPRDKYKRFRNQLVKEKNKIYRLKQDVKRKQMLTDTAITIPIPKLKKRNKVMYD